MQLVISCQYKISLKLVFSKVTRPVAGRRGQETWSEHGVVGWNAALVKIEAAMVLGFVDINSLNSGSLRNQHEQSLA